MDLLDNNFAVLQLEEILHTLEDSLQHNVLYNSYEKQYIQRLKQLYSPRFDIEHSETGSYYHAILQCIKTLYLDSESVYHIFLSVKFKTSMNYLLKLNSYTLDTNNHHSQLTENLLSLSELWSLQSTLEYRRLIGASTH